jgi:hypothetical protein
MNDGAWAGFVGRRDHTTSGGTTIAGWEGVGLGAVAGGGGSLDGVGGSEEAAMGDGGGGMESCLGSGLRVSGLGYKGEGW